MEWHQTSGNHVFDVFDTVTNRSSQCHSTNQAPFITTSLFSPIKVSPTSYVEDMLWIKTQRTYTDLQRQRKITMVDIHSLPTYTCHWTPVRLDKILIWMWILKKNAYSRSFRKVPWQQIIHSDSYPTLWYLASPHFLNVDERGYFCPRASWLFKCQNVTPLPEVALQTERLMSAATGPEIKTNIL